MRKQTRMFGRAEYNATAAMVRDIRREFGDIVADKFAEAYRAAFTADAQRAGDLEHFNRGHVHGQVQGMPG